MSRSFVFCDGLASGPRCLQAAILLACFVVIEGKVSGAKAVSNPESPPLGTPRIPPPIYAIVQNNTGLNASNETELSHRKSWDGHRINPQSSSETDGAVKHDPR